MPVNTIRADIVDLQHDIPSADDQFVVDTNGWKELTYARVLNPKPGYPEYIKKALTEGAKLYACGISLMELASAIEKDEWQIHCEKMGAILRKDFRHDHVQARSEVVAQVQSAWAQVKQFSDLVDLHLDASALERALATFVSCPMDGYDTLLVEAMTRRGVFNVITDDSDFATVPNLTVFTANMHILSVGRRQGRLRRRG